MDMFFCYRKTCWLIPFLAVSGDEHIFYTTMNCEIRR
jgi:hypothetical protein